MGNTLLKVENLSAFYGGIRAIDNISFEVNEGEIVSVLGANGAGKSTLLKCLSGEHKRAPGTRIMFNGSDLSQRPYQVVNQGVAIVPEGRQIFTKLTVAENLQIGCCQRKDAAGIAKDLEMVYELFPRLKEREKQYGGLLSGGEQQMLAIGRGLMAKPKLMMLDEPSLGLAPIIVNHIMEILKEVQKNGMTILLVEQNAKKALSISDRAYVMNVGRIIMEGTGKDLLANNSLMDAYLGV